MKTKIVMLLAICAVFGLAIAAFAYTTNTKVAEAKTCCCSKDDSCPMKSKMGHDKAAGHEGKSCPMDAKKAEHKHGECCGDSCPMKKGEASADASASDGKDCCDNCDCCSGKDEIAA